MRCVIPIEAAEPHPSPGRATNAGNRQTLLPHRAHDGRPAFERRVVDVRPCLPRTANDRPGRPIYPRLPSANARASINAAGRRALRWYSQQPNGPLGCSRHPQSGCRSALVALAQGRVQLLLDPDPAQMGQVRATVCQSQRLGACCWRRTARRCAGSALGSFPTPTEHSPRATP